MVVNNVTFANFASNCDNNDTVITSNPFNNDGQHPVIFERITTINVSNSSMVFLYRPDLNTITPSECGDMDCDGLKKNLLTDSDGSFLGEQGCVTSQSEYGWGSQQRGLGDFRIPKELLTDMDGSLLNFTDVYDLPGMVRNLNYCSYEEDWQAYKCFGIKYKMLIIESMDTDTGKLFFEACLNSICFGLYI